MFTPQGAIALNDFLSNLLGKPISSFGRSALEIKEGELDTEIANCSASTVAAMVEFLANDGIHLKAFVDHTDGLPEFGLYGLQKQPDCCNASTNSSHLGENEPTRLPGNLWD
jgi:hypothetical protein